MIFRIEIEQEEYGRWLAEVTELSGVMAYVTTSEEAVARGAWRAFGARRRWAGTRERLALYEPEPGIGILEALTVHNEFMAIIEQDGDWHIAYCPEVPGANGQGRTKDEACDGLAQAVALILEDRREDGLRGVPPDAIRETITVL